MLANSKTSNIPKGVYMEGYCLKCRTKREIKGASSVTLKNGRPATQGTCPVCGTKITVIGKGVAK